MNVREKLIKVMSLNVVLWLLMLLALTGLLACAGGVYLLLAERVGQTDALLITGGGLIGLSGVLTVVALVSGRKQKRATGKPATGKDKQQPVRHDYDNAIEAQIRPILGDQATDWAKQNTGMAVAGALTAGVLLAASPRLRAAIVGAASPIFTRKAMQAFDQFTSNN